MRSPHLPPQNSVGNYKGPYIIFLAATPRLAGYCRHRGSNHLRTKGSIRGSENKGRFYEWGPSYEGPFISIP